MRRTPFSQSALRLWARAAVRVFYRRVDVEGLEHLPVSQPMIFAVNHTNALADVAVIVAKLPTFPHFLAATAWWKHGSARLLFRLGGVLPVRRTGDPPGPQDNRQTFDACSRALADHASLAIFPEGVMHLEPGLLRLKHGTARIALRAADSGVRGVVIVPMGLVYEDRGRFRSDAAVRFGKPIAIDDWLAAHAENAHQTVRAITAQLTDELTRVIEPLDRAAGPARLQELVFLAPAAAVGALAHAPLLAAGGLANRWPDVLWHASIKGVVGTFLLPVTYGTSVALLCRRYGARRAVAVTLIGAMSGRATLAWIDRRRDYGAAVPRQQRP
jgi:1-acyl-sn-glycerol-3-phosphate acyltransferase